MALFTRFTLSFLRVLCTVLPNQGPSCLLHSAKGCSPGFHHDRDHATDGGAGERRSYYTAVWRVRCLLKLHLLSMI